MSDRTASTISTVETVKIGGPDAEARGRNGWFRPAKVAVQRFGSSRTITIAARSARQFSDMPPIYVSLPLDDARRVHEALGRQVAALEATAQLCPNERDEQR